MFLTVMWHDIPAALAGLPPWDGRVLVDAEFPPVRRNRQRRSTRTQRPILGHT